MSGLISPMLLKVCQTDPLLDSKKRIVLIEIKRFEILGHFLESSGFCPGAFGVALGLLPLRLAAES